MDDKTITHELDLQNPYNVALKVNTGWPLNYGNVVVGKIITVGVHAEEGLFVCINADTFNIDDTCYVAVCKSGHFHLIKGPSASSLIDRKEDAS